MALIITNNRIGEFALTANEPAFNLHLKTTGVTELWRVRKPSVDGIVTSYEGFDADGELVIQLFGVRKPGVPERDDWRALAETATTMSA